jgi:hypothetical protein
MRIIILKFKFNEGGKNMREACFTKALTVAFSPEIYLRIKEITDKKKISMGEWVRVAAEKALENEKLLTI